MTREEEPYLCHKKSEDLTNEEMDYMEDILQVNPSGALRRGLGHKHIPVSCNYSFFRSQKKLPWLFNYETWREPKWLKKTP